MSERSGRGDGGEAAALRQLADASCEGPLGPAEAAELETLLADDLFRCQEFVGYMQIHAALLLNREQISPAAIDRRLRDRMSEPAARRPAVGRRGLLAAAAATSAVVIVAAVWTLGSMGGPAPAVGKICIVSEDARWRGGPLRHGSLIRPRASLGLSAGFVTVELGGGARVDLIGPVRATFVDEETVELKTGLLAGRVLTRGQGLTVVTDDAEIVDIGTEFLVREDATLGTQVHVISGRVDATLRGDDGRGVQKVELRTGEMARLSVEEGEVDSADFGLFDMLRSYRRVEEVRGGILAYAGAAVPAAGPDASTDFRGGQTHTEGRVVFIPEVVGLLVSDEVTLRTVDGEVRLSAGEVVDSYLAHFDIGDSGAIRDGGRGSVTFGGRVLAVLADGTALEATDRLFSRDDRQFEAAESRGLESDSDSVSVSPDRTAVTFDLNAEAVSAVDQFRVLVRGTQN